MTDTIDNLRQRGVLLVTLGGWVVVVLLAIMALAGQEYAWTAAIIGATLNLIPSICAVQGRTDSPARLAIAVMAVMQPSLLVYAMQGSLWQIDTHLYFFVALTALILLWDIFPIIVACVIIMAHHAILSALAPDWVFWGGGGIVRVSIHAIGTLLIGSVIGWASHNLGRMLENIEEARRVSAAQAEELQATTTSLEEALERVREEREETAHAKEEAANARKATYDSIAAEFERSVSAVTHSVAQTADMLEGSARGLKMIAKKAGKEAGEVASSAESARKAARTVAAGVAEMSLSISNIAVNVSQQSELTARATARTGGGGTAIGSLSQQSRTIEETTRAIVRIAERTDLLSLNAAIEAASAGAAGRGFTIVAQEVKALATQASDAATEIDVFLSGVRSGTVEAEQSFEAIDAAIAELNNAASSISYDVENQRQSADTIEAYARNASGEADAMVDSTKSLSERAIAARDLSEELEKAAAMLAENVRNLERSTRSFVTNLKAA